VMLQQTQVRTVLGYFDRFVEALPSLAALAGAPLDRVLALWSGLGYYSRARNLHRAAQICMERHGGELPSNFDALAALPGIGRSTAAAILAQAFGLKHAILDGNVRRVLARWHGVRGWPGATQVQLTLWRHAGSHTPCERRDGLRAFAAALRSLPGQSRLRRAARRIDGGVADAETFARRADARNHDADRSRRIGSRAVGAASADRRLGTALERSGNARRGIGA